MESPYLLGILAPGRGRSSVKFASRVVCLAGFEHCVANMYFIPLGMMVEGGDAVTVAGLIHNLVPVTLGNLVGGAGMVGLTYYVIYRRGEPAGT